MILLHPFPYSGPWPEAMNNPLDYEPHAVCRQAISEALPLVRQLMGEQPKEGKMFGVLVVGEATAPAFLLAFSGQVADRASWPGFVPPVFDYLQPDGHFKREEAAISNLNAQVEQLTHDPAYLHILRTREDLQQEADAAIQKALFDMQTGKRLRDERRREGFLSASEQEAMVRESQFQKAELRRTRQRYAERDDELQRQLAPYEERLQSLRHERKQRSEALQQWLFNQFAMLNAHGEERTLTDIFASTMTGFPPSGAGECCEPKLLQYAFAHGLQPRQMAMFWYGPSPREEVRHHLQCYPACRGKCKPILEWMLADVLKPAATSPVQPDIKEMLRTDRFLIIDKPAGLLSVPGNTGEPSVESILQEKYGEAYIVHRLDQDTSGLMVVARDKDMQSRLQRQFERHEVEKTYIAELEHPVLVPGETGTISLPLSADPLNRPYQRVDFRQGREAVTRWKALTETRLELHPETGRTHQLRIHCAHQEGLGCPIRGDRLYGTRGNRLCLHAARLTFNDPDTNERLSAESQPPF